MIHRNKEEFVEILQRAAQQVESLDMKIEDAGNPGRNEFKQYVYYLLYPSAIRSLEGRIKLEIGLRFNSILPAQSHLIQHAFLHPFTGEPLFDGGKVNCLPLKEIVSEKLRAAALRKTIAPRDFYDLDFILRNDFNLTDTEVRELIDKPPIRKFDKHSIIWHTSIIQLRK